MRIQAIQKNVNFGNSQVLKAYNRAFLSRTKNDINKLGNNTLPKCGAIVNGTLLGISTCSIISAFTENLKMIIPGVVAGALVVAFNLINFSKDKYSK